MIDEFYKYVSNYDINDINIKLKYDHSIRVMELCNRYSKLLGFSDEDIKLATVIGLLHDIGRFEQLKVYNTFDDNKSIDHALYGVNELFEKGIIKNFDCNKDDYEIIRFAIYNHNKMDIEKDVDERKIMHAKLIRDMDKIDILYLMGNYSDYKVITTNDPITQDIIKDILNHKSALKLKINNPNDNVAVIFSYVFDLNSDICMNEVKENVINYYNSIKNKEIFKDIYNEVIKYIDERMIIC